MRRRSRPGTRHYPCATREARASPSPAGSADPSPSGRHIVRSCRGSAAPARVPRPRATPAVFGNPTSVSGGTSVIQRGRVWSGAALLMSLGLVVAACSDDKTPGPTTPTPTPTPTPPRLTAPIADGPETNKQLDTLRPTLTVRNATSRPGRRPDLRVPDLRQRRVHRGDHLARAGLPRRRQPRPACRKAQAARRASPRRRTCSRPPVFYWRARAVQGTTTSAVVGGRPLPHRS